MKRDDNHIEEPGLTEVHEHFRRAVERLTADIVAAPLDTDARVKRAVVYRVLGDFEQAMQDYEALKVSVSADPTVRHSMGIALLGRGSLAAAAQAFDHANESDPWDVESYYRRVETRLALGEHRLALEVLDEFVEKYPCDALAPGEWELIQRQREQRESKDARGLV